jgi:peptide subunit release factor 1 (eRF1)
MQVAQELFQKLSVFAAADALVLSIYLDMSLNGERPAQSTAMVALKDRLRAIEKTLLPRNLLLDDFREDRKKVQRYLQMYADTWPQGIAIFACHAQNLFEVLETNIPFQNQVAFELHPDLFQLARLLDEQETVVTALVDTNTTRLFVTRRGFLEEVAGPDDAPFGYGKRQAGALNQKRYQRRADNKRKEFAREAATALEDLVKQEGARRVVLAGDEVAIPILHRELSSAIEPLVHEEVLRLDIRTPRDEVHQELQPVIEYMEEESSHSQADRLVEALRQDGLAVSGEQETQTALEHGQVDVLLLANDVPLNEQKRSELVRLAAKTNAEIETVQGHVILQQLGGVGALLRYRPHWL